MTKSTSKPGIIRSGAQTGADQGALFGALDAGFLIHGWVPRGWITEEPTGVPHELRYFLKEAPTQSANGDYTLRTELNIRDSDATLVIHHGKMGVGTQGTIARCIKRKAPLFVLNLRLAKDATRPILGWASTNGSGLKAGASLDDFIAAAKADVLARDASCGPFDLNVAGPRESHAPGLQAAVHAFMKAWLTS